MDVATGMAPEDDERGQRTSGRRTCLFRSCPRQEFDAGAARDGKKRKRFTGRRSAGEEAVAGVKDRKKGNVQAKVVDKTDRATLQGFIVEHTAEDAAVYTDEVSALEGVPRNHESVKHSVSEYFRDMAHTTGMESSRSMLKRGYQGTYHHMSAKHPDRYVKERAGRHNIRDTDTVHQMTNVIACMAGNVSATRI